MFSIRQVINNLPATLEPSTVYYVRRGTGVVRFVTDQNGTVAVPPVERSYIDWANRWSLFTNNRWVSFNLNRGHREASCTLNLGTGADPTLSFSQIGAVVKPGMRLTSFDVQGVTNNAQVTGIEYRLYHHYGNATPWNSVASTTRDQIVAGSFTYGGALEHAAHNISLDYVIPEAGYVVMVLRPVGNITATRFARLSCRLDLDLPPVV